LKLQLQGIHERESGHSDSRWDAAGRNVCPGPGIILNIHIIATISIIYIIVIVVLQERDFTDHKEKKPEHISSLTRSG
jgi:hypothetical protein